MLPDDNSSFHNYISDHPTAATNTAHTSHSRTFPETIQRKCQDQHLSQRSLKLLNGTSGCWVRTTSGTSQETSPCPRLSNLSNVRASKEMSCTKCHSLITRVNIVPYTTGAHLASAAGPSGPFAEERSAGPPPMFRHQDEIGSLESSLLTQVMDGATRTASQPKQTATPSAPRPRRLPETVVELASGAFEIFDPREQQRRE